MTQALATTQSNTAIQTASPYEPENFERAWQLAKIVADSGLTPALNTPARAFMALATGAMLGVPAMAAINGIHIIEGRVAPSAILLVALVISKGVAEYWEILESDENHCVIETKRVGARKPAQARFDIVEAQRAGLVKDKSNYQKWPADMCIARASMRLIRRVYADVSQGLYAREEMDGGELPPDAPNMHVSQPIPMAPKDRKRVDAVMSHVQEVAARITPVDESPKTEAKPAQEAPAQPAPVATPAPAPEPAAAQPAPEPEPFQAEPEDERPWAKAMLDAAKAGAAKRDIAGMANATVKAGTATMDQVKPVHDAACKLINDRKAGAA